MTLKSFPRGGKKPIAKPSSGLLHKTKLKNNAERTKKRNEKQIRESKKIDDERNLTAKTAQCLSYSSLTEGMVILARVHNVTEYDVVVSLPNRLSGRIRVTEFSEAYNKHLRSIVEIADENNDSTDFRRLTELYKWGDYVICYVKSLTPNEKWHVALSLEPQLINENLDPSRLSKGSKIVGTISSVEEHGYIVDVGLDNCGAFLSSKDVDGDAIGFYPGKQVFCTVKSVQTTENSTTIKLSTKSKHVKSAITEDAQSLDAVVPGTKFVLTIDAVLSNGLQVLYNNDQIGYINRFHLDKPLSSYERGRKIHGTLLYITPTIKFAYFTLLISDEPEEILAIGTTFEKATVLFRESNGIVMNLKKGIRGFIPYRRTEVPLEKIPKIFVPGAIHTCRILAYDCLDQIYVCTMEKLLLQEEHLNLSNLTPGELLQVKVTRIQQDSGFVMVTAGRISGWIQPEHLLDVENNSRHNLKVGDVLKARVLGRDKNETGILFTINKSLIASKLPILCNINAAKVGKKYDGIIVQINNKGLLVSFYDGVKGWVPSDALDKRYSAVKWNFAVGQVITVKIVEVDKSEKKLKLAVLKEEEEKEGEINESINFKIGETVEGTVVDVSVEGVYLKIQKNSGKTIENGFLPAGHVAACRDLGRYLSARFSIGETITALVFSTFPSLILSRTFVPQENSRNLDNLKIGDSLPTSVQEITSEGLKLIVPIENFNCFASAPRDKVDNYDSIYVHQLLFGKITYINKIKRKIILSMSLHEILNETSEKDFNLVASIDTLTLHFNKLRELSESSYYKNKSISKVRIGERISGTIEKITDDGLILKLDNDISGTVRQDHYTGKVNPGDRVTGVILWVNYIYELVEVTLLPVFMNSISSKQSEIPKVSLETQMRGDIALVTNWFVLVVLKGSGKGSFAALPVRRHINDTKPKLEQYSVGRRIRCYVIMNKRDSGMLPICLLKSSFESMNNFTVNLEKKTVKRKSDLPESSKKKKIVKLDSSIVLPSTNEKTEIEETKKKISRKEIPKKKLKRLKVESHEAKNKIQETEEESQESVEIATDSLKKSDEKTDRKLERKSKTKKRLAIPACGFSWDNELQNGANIHAESSSDEDEIDDQPKETRRKKLSAAERRNLEREKEREIREREEALANNSAPNSVDQFDRLVLSSPDNSMIWLQYMAYHLQATEIEKARAIAKRAVKTINFRDEAERFNIWQAWLNLESKFGSPESLNSVFKEAVNTNDALNVYLHMLVIHVDAGRQNELEKTITTILGKFKQNPNVWVECGTALLKIGLKDKSRHIMQRALQSLPPQEHVNLMAKFAQMENKYGDKERSQTLYEKILTSYPKRVDILSSYVDALVKSGDIKMARNVLEKAVVQTLPARKMKILFNKFIAFETNHGTPEDVSHVQHLAKKYVENQCNKVES